MQERQIRQILADVCSEIDARRARAAAAGVALGAAMAFAQGCSSYSDAIYAVPYGLSPIDASFESAPDGGPFLDAASDSPTDVVKDASGTDASDAAPSSDAAEDSQ